jgi:hypothetical protein
MELVAPASELRALQGSAPTRVVAAPAAGAKGLVNDLRASGGATGGLRRECRGTVYGTATLRAGPLRVTKASARRLSRTS